MNIYPENLDIPVIKPRTLQNNKNEFNVIIEKSAAGVEVADMKLFRKPIREEAELEVLKELRDKLKEVRAELNKEEKLLRDL